MKPELECSFFIEDGTIRQEPEVFALTLRVEENPNFTLTLMLKLEHPEPKQKPRTSFSATLQLHLARVEWSGGTGEQTVTLTGYALTGIDQVVQWSREQGRKALEAFMPTTGVEFRNNYRLVDRLCGKIVGRGSRVKNILARREEHLRLAMREWKAQ